MAGKTKALKVPTNRVLEDLPFDRGEEGKIEQKAQEPDMQAILAELRGQVAKLSGDLDTANKERLALMTQATPVQPQMRSTEVNLKDLPDPVQEPEKYAQEIAKRTREALQNEQYNAGIQQQQQTQQAGDLEALWEDFKEANPLYADEGKVRYIAQELAQKAAKRKRDVGKYMFVTSDTFFSDVTKLYDKTFGAPKAAGEEDDDDGSVLDDDDNRTAGIPGGGPSGKSSAKPDEDADVSKSSFDGLKQWQLKHGFTA